MPSCSYNCGELPDHEVVNCEVYQKAGVSDIALVDCSLEPADLVTTQDWTDEITAGKVKLIQNVKFEVSDPSAVEVENPIVCGPVNIVIGYDRTIEGMDYNVSEANVDFYNALNGQKTKAALHICEEGKLKWINATIQWNARHIIPNGNRELQHFLVTGSWSSKTEGQYVDAPAGVF
jgi:hypothetical protein